MRTVFRLLAVVVALSTSGVVPRPSGGAADDPCCGDEPASVPDCPPGASCACCPVRPSLPLANAAAGVQPRDVLGRTLAASAPEPVLPAPESDIFHPPRA
jgi:hypothetical protein